MPTMCAPQNKDDIKPARALDLRHPAGLRAVVVGMARSGLAAAHVLKTAGAEVFVSDSAERESLAAAVKELERHAIPFEYGNHSVARLDEADLLVISPGVPADNILVRAARERGIPVHSEIETAWCMSRAPVLAVTGSNGKTTTTSWLGAIYEHAARHAEVGGNIGRPYSSFSDKLPDSARAILEVSTFQLENIETLRPKVASILNLSPDHLDRHGSFDEYVRLKFRLLENQGPEDVAVLNADDHTLREWEADNRCGRAERWWFSAAGPVEMGVWLDGEGLAFRTGSGQGQVPGSDRLIPPGTHNRMNAAAAVAMALADGLTPDEIEPGLTAFPGVEHRLEFVAEVAGVRYVNDSKATNPDSVANAVASFDCPLVIIMGGLDKGTSFAGLTRDIARKARALVFTGSAADKLERELGRTVSNRVVPQFGDAFAEAVHLAEPGDVVLLSPGCASFDQFKNYEHRGDVFKELVTALATREGERTP
jgi:UDP-N-acetylmuramoylalanine--D-glutamate ligase